MTDEAPSAETKPKPEARSDDESRQKAAADFRRFSQAERLADRNLHTAARILAAMTAAIDQRYGEKSEAARRMKVAAVDAIARALEAGKSLSLPKVRSRTRTPEEEHSRNAAAAMNKDWER